MLGLLCALSRFLPSILLLCCETPSEPGSNKSNGGVRAGGRKGAMLNFCRIVGVLLLLFGKCCGWMELL